MKKLKYTILLATIIPLVLSCHSNTSNDKVYLENTEQHISFPLDSETKTSIWALFPYTDKEGKEYLTFQNERKNEILVYDMDSKNLLYKIKPEEEGANGVGRFFGYYIHDLDNIYLTARNRTSIARLACIDKNSRIKEWIKYNMTSDGIPLRGFNALSFIYNPIVTIGDDMYIISHCNRLEKNNPVTCILNMKNKEIKALPFEYPEFPISDNKLKPFSIEMDFSRCYDGKRFIYSFHYDEDIYVTSPDHESVEKIKIKSEFIPEVKFTENMNYGNPMKNLCENPKYGNLYHDKYRNVYYRIAYPENELSSNENFKEIYAYGRKTFSIIILDSNFNIIGETLFPDFIYNPAVIFIREDGLYICNSHFKNPNFDEDRLEFTKFQLSTNKK